MATSTSDSLSELERRAETTRAELAQTVDALHSRVSPAAIRADVRNYVRDNPLQAAAIAVGAAYPVWRLVGAIPAPVLLIGAGLTMARRTGSRGADGYAPSAAGSSAGVMSTLKDTASELGSQITGTAQDTVDTVRHAAADTAARTSDALASTLDSTRRAATDTLHEVTDRASETYARASEQLSDMIERHPLIVGGIAVAVGGILASAVPVSRQESRVMGQAAEDVRRRSQELAMQGLREARNVAREVYDTASEEIRNEGLTPEAARRTARTAVESANEAMEHTTGRGGRS